MKKYLSLIAFSHTIFALPFAVIGFIIGVHEVGVFDYRLLIFVGLCMIFARSAAMGFNRYIDWKIDIKNPRTAEREIPSGQIHPRKALYFVIFNAIGFILSAGLIHTTCLFLAPVALFVIFFYSYSKRFTYLCHLILGMGLGLAPLGAYIAVTGSFSIPVILLAFAVLFWVAGFDIIYAMQDVTFDKQEKLQSIPAHFGKKRALMISRIFHVLTSVLLFASGYLVGGHFEWMSWVSCLGALLFIASLIYQHTLVSVDNLTQVNRAFFTTNGFASLTIGLFVLVDYLLEFL